MSGTIVLQNYLAAGRIATRECSAGVVITAVDAFLFLMLERVGIRNLEAFFGLLIGIMAASFGYMYVDAGVDFADVSRGLLVRVCRFWKVTQAQVDRFAMQIAICASDLMCKCLSRTVK